MKMQKEYGSWESPITSSFITTHQIKLVELGLDENELFWVEGRPNEGGRQVVVGYSEGICKDLTPATINSRSRVHEYGGGSFCASRKKNMFATVDFKTQDMILIENDVSRLIARGNESIFRYGDLVVDNTQSRNMVFAIQEDHTIDEPSNVVNRIVAISINPTDDNPPGGYPLVNSEGDPTMLYASPRVDPTGQWLCWVQWALPDMPWDSSELWVGCLAPDGKSLLSSRRVAGGENVSVELPAWGQSQDTSSSSLFFISDMLNGWWSIYRTSISLPNFGLSSGNLESICVLHCEGYEFGIATWSLGIRRYSFLDDGRLFTLWPDASGHLCGVACSTDKEHCLHRSDSAADVESRGDSELIVRKMPPLFATTGDTDSTNLTSFMCLVVGAEDSVYVIGGSPSLPSGVFKWNTRGAFSSSLSSSSVGELELIRSSMPNVSLDGRFISSPREIQFPTILRGEWAFSHGNYYAPCNPLYFGPEGRLPPLLVKLHGGPTGQAPTVCRLDIQFFTSRGIAVLDVNYGGSTGYGREYRERLNGLWGVVDVEDCCRGAEFLAGEGLVDREKLAIDGGSAGGFTTLACVTFRDTFKAATSSYGIGDLDALLEDTHKFESRYTDILVGPYPEMKHVYDERAPIKHIEKLSCPLLLLQGLDDKVVPPNQATIMYQAALDNGVPAALILFEGEGHGFRKAESIQRALNAELNFYGLIFGFEADVKEAIPLVTSNPVASS